jgi:hypothetical protein
VNRELARIIERTCFETLSSESTQTIQTLLRHGKTPAEIAQLYRKAGAPDWLEKQIENAAHYIKEELA